MPLCRPQKVFLPRAAGQVQLAIQRKDGKPVGMGRSFRRFGIGVAVEAVGHPLDCAVQGGPARRDGLRNCVRRRKVPDYPVGKPFYGVAHILQNNGQRLCVGRQVFQHQLRRAILAPAGVFRVEFAVFNSGQSTSRMVSSILSSCYPACRFSKGSSTTGASAKI